MPRTNDRARTKHAASGDLRRAPSAEPGAGAVSLPSSAVQNEFGRMLDQVRDHDIIVTRHDVARAVLVSAERYRELVGREATVLRELEEQFDTLYARMQSPSTIEAIERGFRATPAAMGKSAKSAVTKTKPRGSQRRAR